MTVLFDGDYGPFEGPEHDRVVFGTYRTTGTWSPELVALLGQRLLGGPQGPGGTLIDVGANLGLVAIPVLNRCRARGIAFEPAPDNFDCLQRNAKRHGLGARLELHLLALSDCAGSAELAMSADNSGDHRLAAANAAPANAAGARTRTAIATARLDDVLQGRELPGPVVMKVDTQGAEVRVLAGARETLQQVDYLCVEYWPAGVHRLGDDLERLHDALRTFSHATVLEQGRQPQRLHPTAEALDSLAWIPRDGSDEGFFDLLLGRSEQLPDASQ